MNFTSEERLLLEQIFRLLETNNDVRYHPHRRLLNRIMNDTAAPVREPEFGWEGVSERLAKVEARQDEFEQRTVKALNEHSERFNLQMDLRLAQARDLNDRIDKVAEIIGERISGLVERLDALEARFPKVWADAAVGDDYEGAAQGTWEVVSEGVVTFPPAEAIDAAFAALPPDAHGTIAPGEMERVLQAAARAAFPTGGAHTAEAAADVVLPVPQRGDRVRLEGLNRNDDALGNGWYDVVGGDEHYTQIELGLDKYGVKRLYNVANHIIKEVRHADH